jgi:hypothetical protein
MPKYEFMCESCEKRFEATHHGTGEYKGPVSELRRREGHPSAEGIHHQDFAEALKTKGVL